MILRKVRALRGPNIWARDPVLEAWVDFGDIEARPPTPPAASAVRLATSLGELPTILEESGERPRFLERLKDGIIVPEVLAHLAREFQALEGTDPGPGQVRATGESGVYRVAIPYLEEEYARACLESAGAMYLAVAESRPFDASAEVRRLRELASKLYPGLHLSAFVAAAKALGIPVQRLARSDIGNLLLFGQGARQRRLLAAKTDRTGALAESISQDKELSKSMLSAVGVPVPEGQAVGDAEEAWSVAEELGPPVVVKPRDADHGHGVSLNLTTREQVVAAYARARAYREDVLVERFIPGDEHRLLVVGDRVVAAVRRDPPSVVGDGRSTVAELVERANLDPRRGDGRTSPMAAILFDETALGVVREQGYGPDSIPEAGVRVLIRKNSHRWSGGSTTDVTDLVHPEVAERAVEAARVIGLDVAGLDLIAVDIGRPLEGQGGVVVEVNAEPALQMHLRPTEGSPRPVCEAILRQMFPQGDDGRIPVVAVTGTNGKTTTTRLLAHLLAGTGRKVGMTCTDGIFVDGRRIETGDCSGPQSARTVLMNPLVEVAVLETARGGILTGGLGFDHCDVAVVTNLGEGDHVGSHGVDTVDEMAEVKRTVVEAVLPRGAAVLNAADPLVVAMSQVCPGPALFFARDEHLPVIVRHRAEGGKALFVRDGSMVLAVGANEEAIVSLDDVPMSHQGRAGFQVENALAATAAALALGLPREAVVAGLASFPSDPGRTPGRFNVIEAGESTVIVDYAHNASALASLIKALDEFPHRRRAIVYSAAGSRRDADIIRQGEVLGEGFDRILLYEDQCNYGRDDGATIALLRQGLAAGPRVAEIGETRGEFVAIEAALNALQPGEILVIDPESIEEALALVRSHLEARPTSGR